MSGPRPWPTSQLFWYILFSSLVNWILFKHYCLNKTINLIQAFLEQSLLWHYCIHLAKYQHPQLRQFAVILISLDSAQLPPLGILLSQFQFPLHLPYWIILIHVLRPPLCSPVPPYNPLLHSSAVATFICWTTNHYSHLLAHLPQLYLTPAADLPFVFYWDIFPNAFSSRLKVFNQSQSSLDLILSPQINLLRKTPAMDWLVTQKAEERKSLSFSSGPSTTAPVPNWK